MFNEDVKFLFAFTRAIWELEEDKERGETRRLGVRSPFLAIVIFAPVSLLSMCVLSVSIDSMIFPATSLVSVSDRDVRDVEGGGRREKEGWVVKKVDSETKVEVEESS